MPRWIIGEEGTGKSCGLILNNKARDEEVRRLEFRRSNDFYKLGISTFVCCQTKKAAKKEKLGTH